MSWLDVSQLTMGEQSVIGKFNVFKGLDRVEIGEHSSIGNFNLITCVPSSKKQHYKHRPDRVTELRIGRHSSITMRHLIDCNAGVAIGDFTTVGGYSSQLLTHSIDVARCRQDAHPIAIGSYCFVGTACTILGGVACQIIPFWVQLLACERRSVTSAVCTPAFPRR